MIICKNGTKIIESTSELPEISGARFLFADWETTSGNKKEKSTSPWRHCYPCGLAVTWDNQPGAFYIPVGHHDGNNLDIVAVQRWLDQVITGTETWVNHNIKYDAHVTTNGMGIELPRSLELIDTLTAAKIIDSDRLRKGGYGLDVLARDWLHEEITHYEHKLQAYLGKTNCDYGAIPIDVLGEYAGQDVLTNRRLWKYINANMPEQCKRVWGTEIKLTSLLYRMEQKGMRIDPSELRVKEFMIYNQLIQMDEQLSKIVGRSFRPHVNEDCFDVLCNQYGLPVLGWTEEGEDDEITGEPLPAGNPSFDKEAMAKYKTYPGAPIEVIGNGDPREGPLTGIAGYRKLSTFNSLFVKKYQSIHTNGYLHPNYNQIVRTGRLSCKDPNATQLSPDAKALVHTNDGCSYLSIDYAQIEFRLMMHYTKDERAIEVWQNDPDADFHQFVADMCEVKRKPAKTINFMIGFGGGKKKTVRTLSINVDIVGNVMEQVKQLGLTGDAAQAKFKEICIAKGEAAYNRYHREFPGIKRTSRKAMQIAEAYGYVFNLYGRRRHLHPDVAHIAFNTLNQGSAADIVKEQMVLLDEILYEKTGDDAWIAANVHDEVLIQGKTSVVRDQSFIDMCTRTLEEVKIDLSVPIRTAYGLSDLNWCEAAKGEIKSAVWQNGS